MRRPGIKTTSAQDTVILQCVGIGIITTLGSIGRGDGPNAKGLIGTGLLAVALSGVAVVDGETAVGLGTIALVGSTLATVAGKNLGDVAFGQLAKVGTKIPARGETATSQFEALVQRVETAVGNQAAAGADAAAEGVENVSGAGSIPASGGFAKPFNVNYSAPGGHGRSGNAFKGDAVDIFVPVGTPVYAVQGGRIGTQFGWLSRDPGSPMHGLRMHVLTADGNDWYYAHLSRAAAGIRPGTVIQAGQLLGYSGVANNAAHLHLEDKYQTVRRRV